MIGRAPPSNRLPRRRASSLICGRVRWAYLLVIPIGYMVVAAGPGEALFVMFAVYAAHAPLVWVWRKVFHRRHREEAAVKS